LGGYHEQNVVMRRRRMVWEAGVELAAEGCMKQGGWARKRKMGIEELLAKALFARSSWDQRNDPVLDGAGWSMRLAGPTTEPVGLGRSSSHFLLGRKTDSRIWGGKWRSPSRASSGCWWPNAEGCPKEAPSYFVQEYQKTVRRYGSVGPKVIDKIQIRQKAPWEVP